MIFNRKKKNQFLLSYNPKDSGVAEDNCETWRECTDEEKSSFCVSIINDGTNSETLVEPKFS